jgi:hypothetical protein
VTFEGNAPSVGAVAFLFVGTDAKAYRAAGLTGYGDDGAIFHGLIVATPVTPASRRSCAISGGRRRFRGASSRVRCPDGASA